MNLQMLLEPYHPDLFLHILPYNEEIKREGEDYIPDFSSQR